MDVLSSACPNASMLGKRGKVITEALFCVHLINVTVSDSPQHNCYPEFDQAEGKNGSKPGSLYLGPFLLDDVYENFSYLLLPRFQSYVNFQLLFWKILKLALFKEFTFNINRISLFRDVHKQISLVGYSPWGCRVGHDWVTEQ